MPAGPGRGRSGRALGVALGVVVLALVAVAVYVQRSDDDSRAGTGGMSRAAIVELAPGERGDPVELRAPSLDGEPIDLRDFRGQVLVVNVWGSWCAPCRAEAPVLVAAAAAYEGKGVKFLGIDVRDAPAQAKAFERRYKVTYPSINDPGGTSLLAFRGTIPPSAVPTTLVLDRAGRVSARVLGQTSAPTLRAVLDRVLTEPGGPAASASPGLPSPAAPSPAAPSPAASGSGREADAGS